MSEKGGEALTRVQILQLTGEFDAESIRYLKYDNGGIGNIDALSECKNLIHLNLSYNSITMLNALRDLKSLTFLNLSSNRITNIDALGGLESLEDLNLAGNNLSSTDRLKCLSSISSLKKLRLQDLIHNRSNPLCRESGYSFTVLNLLPQLVTFDGDRVKGRGNDLYQLCRDLDKQIESGKSFGPVVERPLPGPWLKPGSLKVEEKETTISRSEAELRKLLRDCKKLDEEVASKIESLQQR